MHKFDEKSEAKNEDLALMKIAGCKGLGPVKGFQLIQRFGSPTKVLSLKRQGFESIRGLQPVVYDHLHCSGLQRKVEKEYLYLKTKGIEMISRWDPNYPKLLKLCGDAPLILFVKGQLVWKEMEALSIVGTRTMTHSGRALVRRLLSELSSFNVCTVSGLALGVDREVHYESIRSKVPTIAVLGHGFKHLYPKRNVALAREILQNGCLITEFWSDQGPIAGNFVKRNRIIAGMSQATVVVESAEKGGALITAGMAHSYNREVYAFPGRPTDVYSQGCNSLIQNQVARMLVKPKDLFDDLAWKPVASKKSFVMPELSTEAEALFRTLSIEKAQSTDELAGALNWPVQKVLIFMTELEMEDLVGRDVFGNYFKK